MENLGKSEIQEKVIKKKGKKQGSSQNGKTEILPDQKSKKNGVKPEKS